MRNVLIVVSALTLGGCAVGPLFERPDIPLEGRFAFAGGEALKDAANDSWWTTLGDPVLNAFMQEGFESSLNIQAAQAAIKESEAIAKSTGVLSQQLGGDLEASTTRVFADGQTVTNETATLSGTFVFNLFGRADRVRDRAQANLDAAVFDEAATRLALQAEIADAVIQARFFQAAGQATERSINSRARLLANTRELLARGEATAIDEVRARARLAQARASLPELKQGLRLNAVRIATLLDRPTAPILIELERSSHIRPHPQRKMSAGQPADLLRNRPDVLAAERNLAAAYAALGIAYADLYPSLELNGTIRANGTDSLSIGPTLNVPVFNRWNLLAQREAARARTEQATVSFRNTVREAVSDVEQALVRIEAAEQRTASLQRARDDFTELFGLSQQTFRLGTTTLFELLDSQENIENAEVSLAAAQRDLALGVARLAVATGRGSAIGHNRGLRDQDLVASCEGKC